MDSVRKLISVNAALNFVSQGPVADQYEVSIGPTRNLLKRPNQDIDALRSNKSPGEQDERLPLRNSNVRNKRMAESGSVGGDDWVIDDFWLNRKIREMGTKIVRDTLRDRYYCPGVLDLCRQEFHRQFCLVSANSMR